MNHISKRSLFSILIFLFSLLCLNFILANHYGDDDDEDGGSSSVNLSNSYDFQKLGGMAGRLAPHGNDLMGDLIDKNTGGITFEHMDVSIPGNSGLEVALRRKIVQSNQGHTPFQQGFSEWVIDLPIAYTAFDSRPGERPPQFNDGCMISYGDIRNGQTGVGNYHHSTWIGTSLITEGANLYVPGKGLSGIEVDPKKPHDPKSNWISKPNTTDSAGRCATLVVAPDGTKYKFGRHVFRLAKEFTAPYQAYADFGDYGSTVYGEHYISRKHAVYLVTEVEDIHGNWVKYEYTNDARAELTRIHSNDLREINIHYDAASVPTRRSRNSRRISHITANNRTWSYDYVSELYLHKVTLPDGRFWELGDSTDGMREMFHEPQVGYRCIPKELSFSIKHPDGAIGTFQLRETRHLKSSIDRFSIQPLNIPHATDNSKCNGFGGIPAHFRPGLWPIYQALSIDSKTISGNDMPSTTWDYEYRDYSGGDVNDTWTKITGPDGTERTYTHKILGPDFGLLKKIEVNPVSGAGETISYEHNTTAPKPSSCELGDEIGNDEIGDVFGMCHGYKHRPVTKVVQKRGSDTYTTETKYKQNSAGEFIDHGFPNETKRYSSVGGSTTPRETDITYEHKVSANIIGLTKRVVLQNVREAATYTYDTLGQLKSKTRYGKPDGTFTYHTSGLQKGALATATDAIGRTISATNYKRGTPQKITRADGKPIYVTVDNNGWMTSSKDAKGYITNYSRDNMGRLTLIDPHGSWADTLISYNFSGGGAVQTITKSQSRETITYDSMYRPILERTQALDTGWSSFINTKYNSSGQVKFRSQPSFNSSETKGVDYIYDGLGRIYQERENVAPYATTKHRYYSQNRHRIYDPSNAWTDYYSYGYDGPDNSDYRAIYKYANGAYQQHNYLYKNIYGQLTRLRQWGNRNGKSVDKSQYFYYDDASQRLCRHYVPEHGTTKYQYDATGQMIAYAKGQSNTNTHCKVPASSAKVSQSYDVLGRPIVTDFAHAGTPDISRTYDPNGNLLSNTRGSGSTAVKWQYYYNSLNMVDEEHLFIDGRGYGTYHFINSAGHYIGKETPSGWEITYELDGLGRKTTVRAFDHNNDYELINLATNINYHANGSVASMAYTNGQNFTQSLNLRLLPQRILSYKGSQKAIDQTLSYDARSNITSIIDGAVTGNNRVNTYDGLGQLKTASGPWGSGSFDFDSLGNLRSKTLGSRTVTLNYDDSKNRLSQSIDTGSSGNRAIGYDARGNVTSLGNLSFVYDMSDQPVSVSGIANGIGASNGTYTYDGNLKRVKSVVNGKTIYNVYDFSGQLVHIHKLTDNKRTDFVNGPQGSLARITDDTSTYSSEITYLHPDILGSAKSGTNSAGNVVWRQQHTPFGEEIKNVTANHDLDGFTGHIKDKSTGLNYMQARYYDPVIGRFLSIDPVGFVASSPMSFNRYAYAINNPYKYTDPNGEFAFLVPLIKPAIAVGAFVAKEVAAEVASRATNGATDFLSARRTLKNGAQQIVKSTRELRGGSFNKAKAERIKESGGKCEYCQTNEATQGDHAKTLNTFKKEVNEGKMTKTEAKAVANHKDNIVASCKKCNEVDKHMKDLGNGPGQYQPTDPVDRVVDMMDNSN